MIKQKKNEKGFTAIEVLIIIIVVIAIAVAGVLVWHNHDKSETKTNNTSSSQSSATTSPSDSASTKNGVLNVKEWGVNFDYDNSNATLQYAVYTKTSNSILLTSSQLVNANTTCSLSAANAEGIGIMTRGKPSDSYAPDATFQQVYNDIQQGSNNPFSNDKTVSLGGYIYIYQESDTICNATPDVPTGGTVFTQAEEAANSIFK